MLARVSIISTEQKRAGVQVYGGPKAVRDHGRVATRNSGGAADKATPGRPVDSGFDLPVDSRAADEAPPLLSRPKVFITATLADGLVVSSAPRDLTP